MSSPYGWGATPSQPSNNGVPESAPTQASGYSQQNSSGFSTPNQPQTRQSSQPAPQYGFGAQPQQGQQYSQPQQGAPQYGFAQQSQGQQPQSSASYGFNNGQDMQQPADSPYQQGINSQPPYQGNYPSMQGQFDNNDKYNTKAVLGFIFTFVIWPVGLVLSILGRNEIKRNGGKGKGLTTASFVLCGISLVSAIVILVMAFTGAFALDSPTTYEDHTSGYSYSYEGSSSSFNDDSYDSLMLED